MKAEQRAHPLYVEAIAYFETVKDYGTRALLTDILRSEEEHMDHLETELGLIEKIGEERYMQTQIKEGDD